jgi:mono/diheme cytochrome c family protein
LIVSLVALAFSAPALAGGDAAKGKPLYEQNCASCHGPDAKGIQGLGKDLTSSSFVAQKSDAELVKFVNEGRAADDPLNTTGILMPPKAGNPALTDEDIQHIVAYLRTLQKK